MFNMRVPLLSLLILAVYCCLAMSEGTESDLKQIVQACRKETGVNGADMDKLMNGKMNKADATDIMKCSIKCVFLKMGFLDQAGEIKYETIKAAFPNKPGLAEAVDKCKMPVNKNPCETAFLTAMCLLDNKMTVN